MTARVCGAAAATHSCPPPDKRVRQKEARRDKDGEELVVVLTTSSTAAVWLYAAQLSAAIVLEKEVYVDGGAVRRSVGELPLRVLV